jgi:hypothetical protein
MVLLFKLIFFHWKQQDQLILNAVLSSLLMDVLHLVVDCKTSHCVWCTLKQALYPSNSRIMQLHGSFQNLCSGDYSITIFIQKQRHCLMN